MQKLNRSGQNISNYDLYQALIEQIYLKVGAVVLVIYVESFGLDRLQAWGIWWSIYSLQYFAVARS